MIFTTMYAELHFVKFAIDPLKCDHLLKEVIHRAALPYVADCASSDKAACVKSFLSIFVFQTRASQVMTSAV